MPESPTENTSDSGSSPEKRPRLILRRGKRGDTPNAMPEASSGAFPAPETPAVGVAATEELVDPEKESVAETAAASDSAARNEEIAAPESVPAPPAKSPPPFLKPKSLALSGKPSVAKPPPAAAKIEAKPAAPESPVPESKAKPLATVPVAPSRPSIAESPRRPGLRLKLHESSAAPFAESADTTAAPATVTPPQSPPVVSSPESLPEPPPLPAESASPSLSKTPPAPESAPEPAPIPAESSESKPRKILLKSSPASRPSASSKAESAQPVEVTSILSDASGKMAPSAPVAEPQKAPPQRVARPKRRLLLLGGAGLLTASFLGLYVFPAFIEEEPVKQAPRPRPDSLTAADKAQAGSSAESPGTSRVSAPAGSSAASPVMVSTPLKPSGEAAPASDSGKLPKATGGVLASQTSPADSASTVSTALSPDSSSDASASSSAASVTDHSTDNPSSSSAANAPAAAPEPPQNPPDPAILEYLRGIEIQMILFSAERPGAVINGARFDKGDVVHPNFGLRLIDTDRTRNALLFEDAEGRQYLRPR